MSNKQKTVLMKVIEQLDISINRYNEEQSEDFSRQINLLKAIKKEAIKLLPEERQQIIDAFCSTNTSKGMKTFSSVLKDEGEQYYNQKYNENS